LVLDDINKFLFEKNERFAVKSLKLVSAIPRTPAGKVDRTAVQAIADA